MKREQMIEFQEVVKDFREVGRTPSPGEFLYNVFYTLFKRKYLALTIFLTTFVGIILGTYLVTPLWQATAKVRVQLNPKQQLTMYEGITTPGGEIPGVNPANDVIQIVNSRIFAEDMVRKFQREEVVRKREEAPEKTRDIIRWRVDDLLIGKPISLLTALGILSDTPENYFAAAVEEFQEDLEEIELEEDTTVVDVSVWGESPEEATDMANSLTALLLQKNLEMSQAPVGLMIQSTRNQLQTAEGELRAAENQLRRFKESSGIVSYDEEARLLMERLDKYEMEVRNLEGRLASLRVEHRPDHPEIRDVEAQLREYQKSVIPGIQTRLASFPRQEVELARLNQDLKAKQELQAMLKGKLLDLEVLKDTSLGAFDLKVIDPARVYEYVHPDWPRWVINIPLGLIAAVMAAVTFIFFVEYWDSSFKSVRELEERTPLHALGAIPFIGYFRRKRILETLKPGELKIADALVPRSIPEKGPRWVTPYDVIANAMFVKNELPLGKIFLITSPGPREGKSTLAAFLAQTLGRKGKKVLLLDTNLRSPAMEALFQSRGTKGLHNLHEEGVEFGEIVTRVGTLDVAFPGDILGLKMDPFDLLCGDRFAAFLAQSKLSYDFILLDSPAVRVSKDPLALVPLVDGVILVVEANRTQEKAVRMVKEKVEGMGGVIKGLVLNKQINYVPAVIRAVLD